LRREHLPLAVLADEGDLTVSLSSPFWRSTFSVAESPLVDDPLIWNLVPSISFFICLMPPFASPSSICLASIPW
jgi:hypothetical protein